MSAVFERGQTVRRISGGGSFFPNGATALVMRDYNGSEIVWVSCNQTHAGNDIGENWWIPASDLELVAPAEPVRPTRKIVQRETTVMPNGTLVRTIWFKDGSFIEHSGGNFRFESGPIPQPEPTP